MTISYVLSDRLTEKIINGIIAILAVCNDEFVPSLSERYMVGGDAVPSLDGYIENVICSCDVFAVAIDDGTGEIVSFASAQTGHVDVDIFSETLRQRTSARFVSCEIIENTE